MTLEIRAQDRPGVSSPRRDDRVLRSTRVTSAVLVPVLLTAGVILYLFPDDTERLFAWPMRPRPTALVMGAGRRGELREGPTTCQYPLRIMRMEAHLFLLCPGERPAMFPHAIGDGGAPEVVHIARSANQGDVLVGKAQLAPGAGRQLGDPGGVTVVERRFEVHGITKGMTDAVKPELVDAHQGPRFRLYGC